MYFANLLSCGSFRSLNGLRAGFSTSAPYFKKKTHAIRYPKWAKFTVRRHNLIKHGRNRRWTRYRETIDTDANKRERMVNLEKFDNVRQYRSLDHFNKYAANYLTSIIKSPNFFEDPEGTVLALHNFHNLETDVRLY
ncbi:hypothetical protein RF11_10759 [Thelohanellus kitauei]|uniref:Uncharacterized protein n=1 Tax=Thelohanellus kitauei TaxID=669202 RepID=A0A0C2J7C6_THEKT|nr:hypothetical protein RF11_10759 [Thelohanellus kitauei]